MESLELIAIIRVTTQTTMRSFDPEDILLMNCVARFYADHILSSGWKPKKLASKQPFYTAE